MSLSHELEDLLQDSVANQPMSTLKSKLPLLQVPDMHVVVAIWTSIHRFASAMKVTLSDVLIDSGAMISSNRPLRPDRDPLDRLR
jgi:hypothetical protein